MNPPIVTLLDRLRSYPSREEWERFVALYGALLHFWAQRLRPVQDADDLVQDVLILIMEKLPTFGGVTDRSFLAWLKRLLLNRWVDRQLGRSFGPRKPLMPRCNRLPLPMKPMSSLRPRLTLSWCDGPCS
jgi:hypothetical protein